MFVWIVKIQEKTQKTFPVKEMCVAHIVERMVYPRRVVRHTYRRYLVVKIIRPYVLELTYLLSNRQIKLLTVLRLFRSLGKIVFDNMLYFSLKYHLTFISFFYKKLFKTLFILKFDYIVPYICLANWWRHIFIILILPSNTKRKANLQYLFTLFLFKAIIT